MQIDIIKVGSLEANCYILKKDGKVVIIDPGDDFHKISQRISEEVVGILCTHSHFDHIGVLSKAKEYYNAPIYNFESIDNINLEIADFKFKVIKNPGHSYDSISFLIEDKLFSGDFIFENTIGRTDFPTGSMKEMQESIKNILKYPDNLIIYPGHGNITTLAKERINLEYFLN